MRSFRIVFPALLLGAALSLPAQADDTLYTHLGGSTGVARIANDSVALFLADPRIKGDFDNINLDRLRARLADFLCQVANGPCAYKGRSMAASHRGLRLNRGKFNAAAEDLQAAMDQAGIPYWTQNRLMARLAPLQRDIVTQ